MTVTVRVGSGLGKGLRVRVRVVRVRVRVRVRGDYYLGSHSISDTTTVICDYYSKGWLMSCHVMSCHVMSRHDRMRLLQQGLAKCLGRGPVR